MPTSITGIVCNTDYNNTVKIIVFCPAPTGGVTVNWNGLAGQYGLSSDYINTSGGVDYYSKTVTDSQYDSNLGGYAVWTDTFDTNNDNSGTISAVLNGETESKTVNYVTKGYPYAQPGTKPQGMTITFLECDNGMVEVWGNLENKVYDNTGPGSYQAALDSRFQLIAPSTGPLIPPTLIAATTDTTGSTSTWMESSVTNLQGNGTKAALFNLGSFSAGSTLTFRSIGNSGIGAGDFLEESFTVICNVQVTNGVGTTVNQGQNSLYSIPRPTSTTNCTESSLEILSIVSGSTLIVGTTTYNVGDLIPTSLLILNGSNWEGIEEVTTFSTSVGTGVGATFIYHTGCGETEPLSVIRTVNSGASANLQDDYNTTLINTPVNGDVTLNDTVVCSGTVSYQISAQSDGVFVINQNTGTYTFTPDLDFIGQATATYDVICDNVFLDSANIIVDVTCDPVSGGTINGSTSIDVNSSETYFVTGLSGSTPFSYTWSVSNGTINSGQGTNQVNVTATGNAMQVNLTVSNCGGTETITLFHNVEVRTYCETEINIKSNCFTFKNIFITKEGVFEPNRLINYTSGNLIFRSDVGSYNYEITITDTLNRTHRITLKNITC